MAVLDAQGTTFTINSVAVGEIQSFSGMDGEAADIKTTSLASAAHEYRQGLQDFGGFSIDINRDPSDAGQVEAFDQRAAQTASTCVLTLPDQTTNNVATFSAYVKSISLGGEVDGVVTGTINMKITGAVVWSDSTP